MTEAEYRIYQEMFETAGWRELVREAEQAVEHRKEQLVGNVSQEYAYFLRGEIAQLRVILGLEEGVRLARAHAQREESGSDEYVVVED